MEKHKGREKGVYAVGEQSKEKRREAGLGHAQESRERKDRQKDSRCKGERGVVKVGSVQ